jgi:hypothetical protein
MSFDAEKLYSLLPAVYRLRDIELASQLEGLLDSAELAELQTLRAQTTLTEKDAERLEALEERRQRGPLRALLSIISEQAAVLEENLDQLYDDLFIETCAEWVVPYIGDLVGARGVSAFPSASFTQRAFVANTMASRRRKGTASIVEQLARDLTDWNASVVEYFQLLATTQYMNHLRPENLSVASLRDAKTLEFVNTPFDKVTRTADVRRIEPRRGKYNIRNIGIFLWRITDYPLTHSQPFKLDERRYLFDALGKDTQLFNRAEREDQITHLAEPINVPMPFSRRVLHRYLDTRYGLDNKGKARSILLTKRNPVDPSKPLPIPNSRIKVCDLSDLTDSGGNVVTDLNGKPVWAHVPTDKIAIDPVLGRIAFPMTSPPEVPPEDEDLRVTYRYGFSAEMGGGEYGRETTFEIRDVEPVIVPEDQASIQSALDQVAASGGVVEIRSNNYFFESPTINAGSLNGTKIELRAGEGQRPVIVLPGNASGDLIITGGDGAEVTINGLLIGGGRLRVPLTDASGNPNKLRKVRLSHCTLAPGAIAEITLAGSSPPILVPAQLAAPRLVVELPNVVVEIDHSIVGSIRAVAGAEINISDSIIDAASTSEVAFAGLSEDEPGAPLTIENSTVIGKVYTRTMRLASNTIFLSDLEDNDAWPAPVRAERLQQGCVRFSYVPPGSRLPRLYECQPKNPADAARVRPMFTSQRFGDAGYCQLSPACAVEITRGADDQAEMGAFHDLYQPQREANLRASLDEYLRFGLEAGIFYAS